MILLFVLLEFICFIGNGSSEFGVEIENTIYVVDGDNFTIKCPEGTVHSDWTLNLVSLQLSASILDYTVENVNSNNYGIYSCDGNIFTEIKYNECSAVMCNFLEVCVSYKDHVKCQYDWSWFTTDVKYIMGGLVVCFILVVKLLCVCFNIVNVNNKSQTKSQTQLSHLISQVESLNRLHMSQQALHENLSQQAIQSNLPPISPTIMHQLNAGNMNQKDVVQSLQTQIQNELASQQMILQQQNLMQAMQANVNAEEPSSNDNDLKPTASKNIKKSPSIPKMLTPHMQIVIGD